jgi:hypothetical protein
MLLCTGIKYQIWPRIKLGGMNYGYHICSKTKPEKTPKQEKPKKGKPKSDLRRIGKSSS